MCTAWVVLPPPLLLPLLYDPSLPAPLTGGRGGVCSPPQIGELEALCAEQQNSLEEAEERHRAVADAHDALRHAGLQAKAQLITAQTQARGAQRSRLCACLPALRTCQRNKVCENTLRPILAHHQPRMHCGHAGRGAAGRARRAGWHGVKPAGSGGRAPAGPASTRCQVGGGGPCLLRLCGKDRGNQHWPCFPPLARERSAAEAAASRVAVEAGMEGMLARLRELEGEKQQLAAREVRTAWGYCARPLACRAVCPEIRPRTRSVNPTCAGRRWA